MPKAGHNKAVRFGNDMRPLWPLEPGLIYLNHGTVGVTPHEILNAQSKIRREIEANPARNMLRELGPRLRATADLVADRFGGAGEDYVFVENATTGVNAVLRSCDLAPGDEILITDQTYGAVANAVAYACRQAGAKPVVAQIPFPPADGQAVLDGVAAALSPRTRMAVLDHISSDSALLMPLGELVALCHERGVQVLVDGAHAPGQVDLKIPSYRAEWYVANLHKWLFAPRGCAILWAARKRQADLHPAVVSWGLDRGFTAEFDWTGTRDPSAYLSLAAAFAFADRLGPAAIRRHNHELVRAGAELLAAEGDEARRASTAMTASMTLAPLHRRFGSGKEPAQALRDLLLFEHHIEVPVVAFGERLWLRLSAQVYNEIEDFEHLAAVLAGLDG